MYNTSLVSLIHIVYDISRYFIDVFILTKLISLSKVMNKFLILISTNKLVNLNKIVVIIPIFFFYSIWNKCWNNVYSFLTCNNFDSFKQKSYAALKSPKSLIKHHKFLIFLENKINMRRNRKNLINFYLDENYLVPQKYGD